MRSTTPFRIRSPFLIVSKPILKKMAPLLIFLLLTTNAYAQVKPLQFVATLPDVAEVIRAIGGSEVEVISLLSGEEDPHFVDGTPSLILKVSRADAVCAMGLDLESGWLPKVLSKSANAKVQSGGAGFCELGSTVKVLERSGPGANRSMGDIHAAGNPHFNLSPRAMAEGSKTVLDILKRMRPSRSAEFENRQRAFETEMKRVETETRGLLKEAIELSKKGPIVIQYHKELTYFFDLYGINSFGAIEEKSGVPPSAGRLASVSLEAKKAGVRVALASLTAPIKHVQRFSELSGIPNARIATGVRIREQSGEPARTIEEVQKSIAKAIADAATNVVKN